MNNSGHNSPKPMSVATISHSYVHCLESPRLLFALLGLGCYLSPGKSKTCCWGCNLMYVLLLYGWKLADILNSNYEVQSEFVLAQ